MNCSSIITWRGWLFVLYINIYLKHFQKDKISCVKDSFLGICKAFLLNAAKKFKIKKEISLVWRLRLWTYKFKLPCKLVDLFITSESSWKNEVDRKSVYMMSSKFGFRSGKCNNNWHELLFLITGWICYKIHEIAGISDLSERACKHKV